MEGGGGPKRHKAWTTEHYAYRRDALELGEASRAIIGRWEMCRPGFIVSQLERKKKRGPNVTSTGWGFFFFLKNTDEVAEVELPELQIFCFVTWKNQIFCFVVEDSLLLRAAAVGDPVRVNEAALFTAFTSIIS
jgi:hypothetical protein